MKPSNPPGNRAAWLLLLAFFASSLSLALDFSQLESRLLSRFGPAQVNLLRDWQQLINSGNNGQDQEKLKQVNNFFNRHIAFDDDQSIWNQSDYWATPLETIGRGRGDCEDFALAKYYSLQEMGVPVSRLRLIYVKARQGGQQQAHMVLAYYASPGAEPVVLDNLIPQIKPASQRPDLTPIFSFNSEGIWQGTGNKAGNSKFSRWQELQSRARSEGYR